MNNLIGKTLGQYHILRELGRGGMAVVYEAYQPSLNRTVAVKVLPELFTFDRTFVQRFLQEARAAAKLEHPNIVTIHDVGEHDGQYYFVMQKLTGEQLNALIGRVGRLPPARVAHILTQVAAALDYAHCNGIVHRDIKPANIIIGTGDHAWLTDFGIAKAAEGTQITQSGVVIGTPEYMSPEQATGKPVGSASDIYSLGIVLYQMLNGQVPFQADSSPALLYKQVYDSPAPLRDRIPGLPPAVDAVVGKALAKDPAARFRSAGELAAAFHRAVRGQPGALSASAAPTVNAPSAPSLRQRPWAAIAGGVATVVLVGALVAKLLGGGNPSPPAWSSPERPTITVTQGTSAGKPLATFTPSPSSPKPEPSPGKPLAQARQVVKVYAGPGANYAAIGQTVAGQKLDVIAKDPGGQWYRVCCVGAEPVWVEVTLVDATGDLGSIPVVTAVPLTATQPPQPGPTVMPTMSPTPVLTPTPVLPGRGRGKIAFASNRSGNNEIYIMKADGTGQTRLTSHPADDWSPALSPDGTRIAFTSTRSGSLPGVHNIFIMNVDGSNLVQLTYNQAWDEYAAWSPDGGRIAFVSTADSNMEIFAVNVDGSDYRRLIFSAGDDKNPTWSPDGKRLAFCSNRMGNWQIFIMDADGNNQTRITVSRTNDFHPVWSPDGSKIAFVSDRDGNSEIYVMNPDGSNQVRLTNNPTLDEHPTWSPDGTAIAFWSDRYESTNDIYLMWADGSQQTRLTTHPASDGAPSWSR